MDCYFCSIQNWIEDLFWKQLDLNYPGMPDAMVILYEVYDRNLCIFFNLIDSIN